LESSHHGRAYPGPEAAAQKDGADQGAEPGWPLPLTLSLAEGGGRWKGRRLPASGMGFAQRSMLLPWRGCGDLGTAVLRKSTGLRTRLTQVPIMVLPSLEGQA